jgi:two-component system CheB/CheR fusion protein
VRAEPVSFPINDLLDRLRDEFAYHAHAKKLAFQVVPCGLWIQSDPRLLEQMMRNLLSNALKYTKTGRVLLGCRRHEGLLSVEIWDTGIGIADGELHAIFEEYHQIDNPARERGLGLGLSIVQRLGKLLGHRVRVRSQPGKGSVFAIEIALSPGETGPRREGHSHGTDSEFVEDVVCTGTILIVEDDPDERELLEVALRDEGHSTATARDGNAALLLVEQGGIQPDLVLTDYRIPGGLNGLQLVTKLRARLSRQVSVIILTGDTSTETLRDIAGRDCVQLAKPVKARELRQVVQRVLQAPHSATRTRPSLAAGAVTSSEPPVIFIVDDDNQVREGLRNLLEREGRTVEDYADCEAFLEAYRPGREACLLVDAYLPGMNGLELLERLRDSGHQLAAIMITANSDVSMAVQAMKAGALDFLEKPIGSDELLASVERALEQSKDSNKLVAWREAAANHIATLTPRERQIMQMVLAGHPSKNIAADLRISQRTVENHRASIMRKTGTKSLPALARLAVAAAGGDAEMPQVHGETSCSAQGHEPAGRF